jgi:Rps23 Pro-64 3,4-dihydroxylase Tpa1-like proline 4-hydroxylase
MWLRQHCTIVMVMTGYLATAGARRLRDSGRHRHPAIPVDSGADTTQLSSGTYTCDAECAEGDSEADPAAYFGNWWGADATTQEFRAALASNRPVHIQNFLQPNVAADLHRELYNASDTAAFQRFEFAAKNYQFRYSAHYPVAKAGSNTDVFPSLPLATKFLLALDSQPMKRWIEQVAGCKVSGPTMGGATYFRPGDYCGLHTDIGWGPRGAAEGLKRRVTYVFHLAKDWQPVNGGDLVFASPTSFVAASYNSMTIFGVTKAAWHFVTPVWEKTPPDQKRLAIAGWWTSDDSAEAKRLEQKFDDGRQARRHISVIDGATGQKLLYTNRSIQPIE